MRPALFSFALLLAAAPAQAGEVRVRNFRLGERETLSQALARSGLDREQTEEALGALGGLLDFRRVRPDDQLRLVTRDGELEVLNVRQSAVDEWQVRRSEGRLLGSKRTVEEEKRLVVVELKVETSLYEAAQAAGEGIPLVLAVADVLAWDVDFYRDVQRGDRIRALVKKVFVNGRPVRLGELLAAEFSGSTVGRKRVFRYELDGGEASYFEEDGSSARRSFLKSPLKFGLVTSRFGNRFHPLLQYTRAHNGVDYGTPVGTEVWAVANGVVSKTGSDSAAGRHACLRHMNGFETCYLHLSRLAPGIRTGVRVSQKQVFAYSGNTGLSTGPHLHFALKRNGEFINPLGQRFPRAEPVPKPLLADFREKAADLARLLDSNPVAAVQPVDR